VSGHLADTARVGRDWCPGCEPDADLFAEILQERRCERHMPAVDGSEDGAVTERHHFSGTAEADGATCRAWGDWLAGRRRAP
jgi:hypothetical protein